MMHCCKFRGHQDPKYAKYSNTTKKIKKQTSTIALLRSLTLKKNWKHLLDPLKFQLKVRQNLPKQLLKSLKDNTIKALSLLVRNPKSMKGSQPNLKYLSPLRVCSRICNPTTLRMTWICSCLWRSKTSSRHSLSLLKLSKNMKSKY